MDRHELWTLELCKDGPSITASFAMASKEVYRESNAGLCPVREFHAKALK